jgi:hypothetical protein
MMNQVALWAIALGLWANVAVQTVNAQGPSTIERYLQQLEGYVGPIFSGSCPNPKICH